MRYAEDTGRGLAPGGDSGVVPAADLTVELRPLVAAQLRRECRRRDYDWKALLGAGIEWPVAAVVRRRALQQRRENGRHRRTGHLTAASVCGVVRQVISEWTAAPELRPNRADFCNEQARRGDLGRHTQAARSRQRAEQVQALVAQGLDNNAEIGRRLGLNRSTVARLRRSCEAATAAAPAAEPASEFLASEFPAPEVPLEARWPAEEFVRLTGIALDAEQARFLVEAGRSYEYVGWESDLRDALRACAGPGVRDPWAYIQRCVRHCGDGRVVSPDLLTEALLWAGENSLWYALIAIESGYVRRPMPYLREVARAAREHPVRWPERGAWPVHKALELARRLAPSLLVMEDECPAEPVVETPDDVSVGAARCIGLKGSPDDLSFDLDPEKESSTELVKADATPVASRLDDAAFAGGADRRTEFVAGPCPHPMAVSLVSGMELSQVAWVACACGCGHELYSDRGAIECPCHWSPERLRRARAEVERILG